MPCTPSIPLASGDLPVDFCLHRRAISRHLHASHRVLVARVSGEGLRPVLGEARPHPLLLGPDPSRDRRQHSAGGVRDSPRRQCRSEVRVIGRFVVYVKGTCALVIPSVNRSVLLLNTVRRTPYTCEQKLKNPAPRRAQSCCFDPPPLLPRALYRNPSSSMLATQVRTT